jgi:hypothetical protein
MRLLRPLDLRGGLSFELLLSSSWLPDVLAGQKYLAEEALDARPYEDHAVACVAGGEGLGVLVGSKGNATC